MNQCSQCKSPFEITDEDRQLYDKVSPIFDGKKYSIPNPILCPACRWQIRSAFRNDYVMYRRASSLSGKPIVSIYSPDKPYTVYLYDEWWRDDWDALEYGRDFDFTQPFFEQFEELFLAVPKLNLIQDGTSENCEYTNFGSENKNCYLTVGFKCEDVYYSDALMSKDCMDCFFVDNGEKLYECVDCGHCYNAAYLQSCQQCSDSYFLESCTSCKNCLGCKNLNNKEYHIFNKLYSREEYERLLSEYKINTYRGIQEFKKHFEKFKLTLPFRFSQQKMSENSAGNFLFGAKNCFNCFKVYGAENCRHSYMIGLNCHDIIDTNNGNGALHCGADGVLNSMHILFSHYTRNCSEIFYSSFCYNCHNLFGCTGLNRKKYCIFNKQYSKEEYEKIVPKIIEHMMGTGEWGQYFPPSISAFGYNESFAYDFAPLTKEEALKLGFKWSDYNAEVTGTKTIPVSRLPETISEVPDDILNWAIICEVTGRPFKVIAQELKFYRKQNLPLPQRHPDQRRHDRLSQKNTHKLYNRKCANCQSEIRTTYSPDRPEKVYCEQCYLKEIY